MSIAFDDIFFDTDVTFAPPSGTDQHAAASMSPGSGVTLPAYIEFSVTGNAPRTEEHYRPEAPQGFRIFTRQNPNVGTDWLATWGGVTRVCSGSATQDPKSNTWMTRCTEIA